MTVDDAYARLAIETNGTINLLTALHLEGTNAASESPSPARPVKTRRGKKEPVIATETPLPSTGTLALSLPAKISVGSIVLSNAHLEFSDRSLQPNVNASIEEVSGTISGLSSDELQRADVNLAGKVDKTAPVEITGKLNPLNQKQPTDLKIVFKNMDLHPAGPYSGKFLGYRLNKGKLSLDLTYHISERTLKSQNLIVLDQLMLGEKVESPDATKLPVRLAIAVLNDRNAIRYQKLEKQFRAKKWKALRKTEQARLTPDEVQLAPEERVDYLQTAYAAAFSPEAIAARVSKSGTTDSPAGSSTNRTARTTAPVRSRLNPLEKGATALMKQATPIGAQLPSQDLEAQLLESIEVTTSDFEALATQRAQRVRDYILKSGNVESERVFLTQSAIQTIKGSRVYLHLQ